MTKPCPSCGGVMEKHTGAVNEPVMLTNGQIGRHTRLASFWACNSCEHCEER
jgi:hypothetical protein